MSQWRDGGGSSIANVMSGSRELDELIASAWRNLWQLELIRSTSCARGKPASQLMSSRAACERLRKAHESLSTQGCTARGCTASYRVKESCSQHSCRSADIRPYRIRFLGIQRFEDSTIILSLELWAFPSGVNLPGSPYATEWRSHAASVLAGVRKYVHI